jgi:diaminopimelate epimerase
MQIEFTKMHGLGNDFMVINAITQSISLSPKQIRFLGARQFGIGFDQLLLVEKSDTDSADFRYRIYNADGAEVEQCGNGARCFARFVRDEGLTDKTEISVITKTGKIILKVESDETVTVDMGSPILQPEKIPFSSDQQSVIYHVNIGDNLVEFCAVSMGNPHAVILVDDIETAAVETIGKSLQADSNFPQSVNVGFMQVHSKGNISLRVYERGVGETQACGTGACAAVVAGRLLGLLDENVAVSLLGGELKIHWIGSKQDFQHSVKMTGPTATVFKGTITL